MTTVRPMICPQCGGREFLSLEKGTRYRCLSCNSEFLVEGTDAAVSVPPPSGEKKASPFRWLIVSLLLLIVAVILVWQSPSQRRQAPAPAPAASGRPAAAIPKPHYDLQRLILVADPAAGGAPLLLRVRGSFGRRGPAGYVADVYDLRAKTWLHEPQRLQDGVGEAVRDARFQLMSDGRLFLVLDKTRLFSFDFASKVWVDARPLLEQQPELAGSVVQIETGYPAEGDALRVMTADGVRRYFYPGVQLAPTYDELTRLVVGYRHPDAEQTYGFAFAVRAHGGVGPQQLVRYSRLDNKNGPRVFSGHLEWTGEGDGRRIVVHNYIFRQAHLGKVEFFTPERRYYRASVLHADKEEVIIFFCPDPNPNTPFLLQSLDPETAAVRWTLQGKYGGEICKTADGLYLQQGMKVYRISDGRQTLATPEQVF